MGRLGSISPEPAEWFAGKQGHTSGFLRDTLKEVCCLMVRWMLRAYTGSPWDLPVLYYRNEACVLLLNSDIDAAFLRSRMRLSCFQKGGRGCSACGWCDKPHKHFNESCLGQWWESQFLNLELSEHFPWKGAFWKYVHICHRLILSQVPKEHSKYSNTQPRALQVRLRWASLFCLPFFCWPLEVSQDGSPIQQQFLL